MAKSAVFTMYFGTNADLITHVADLYLPEGALVADVTYGKGVFWRKCTAKRFTLLASDLHHGPSRPQHGDLFGDGITTHVLAADLGQLPYRTSSLDVVVLDPPYIHNPGQHVTDRRYNNAKTTKRLYHRDILAQLYIPGMREAARVLKPGGSLWVKCKDEIESGEQRWSHQEIYDVAKGLGYFRPRDQAMLHAQATTSPKRWTRQLHLRKNHSVLWIFERTETPFRSLKPGRPKGQKNRDKAITVSPPRGTGVDYLRARLARDHPYIFAQLQAKEFRSVYAAAKAAGIVKARAKSQEIA
jgi:hypothetical protein